MGQKIKVVWHSIVAVETVISLISVSGGGLGVFLMLEQFFDIPNALTLAIAFVTCSIMSVIPIIILRWQLLKFYAVYNALVRYLAEQQAQQQQFNANVHKTMNDMLQVVEGKVSKEMLDIHLDSLDQRKVDKPKTLDTPFLDWLNRRQG